MIQNDDSTKHDDFLLFFFYIIPFFFNSGIVLFIKGHSNMKGAILDGFPHYLAVSIFLFIILLTTFKIFDILGSLNKNLNKSLVVKIFFLSPFFYFWIIALLMQIFLNKIVDLNKYLYIAFLIIVYSLLFIFQYKYIKKIQKYKSKG